MNEATFFVTTHGESDWIPEFLECAPMRTIEGPNRSDYLLVTVLDSEKWSQLILATRHQGTSFFNLPESGCIGTYIVQLTRDLSAVEGRFEREDISRGDGRGLAFGPEAARKDRLWQRAKEVE